MAVLGTSDNSGSTERTIVTRNEITSFLKFGLEVEAPAPGRSLLTFPPSD